MFSTIGQDFNTHLRWWPGSSGGCPCPPVMGSRHLLCPAPPDTAAGLQGAVLRTVLPICVEQISDVIDIKSILTSPQCCGGCLTACTKQIKNDDDKFFFTESLSPLQYLQEILVNQVSWISFICVFCTSIFY